MVMKKDEVLCFSFGSYVCVVLSCHHLSKLKVYFSVYNIIFPKSTLIILCLI
jgi:hypothetical protein